MTARVFTEETEKMPTVEEEFLLKDVHPHLSGFTPRPVEKLAKTKPPCQLLDLDCQHFLHRSTKTSTHTYPCVQYQLWLEAGKHDPPFPKYSDTNYNSNVWRNFRRNYGFQTSSKGRNISDVIAAMYPLNIPPPSQLNDRTFDRYIKETALFKDENRKAMAIKQIQSDLQEFRKLKFKTEARNPPIDQKGNILPPENFKKYVHQFIPLPTPPPSPPPPYQKTDMFGQRYIPRSEPRLWKLSHKLNHPELKRLQEEINKRRIMAEELRKQNTRTLPSPVSFEDVLRE